MISDPNLAPVDLRSDTVTRPSAEMRRAIAEAAVGDDTLGDDPTVAELERVVADRLGKERALFFPSGIMANQTAVMIHAPSGTEAIIDADGHILNYEEGAAAAWGGVQLRAVHPRDRSLRADEVAAAIRPRSPYAIQSSLLLLENTHNSAGGRILPVERMAELVAVARDAGLAVHLDGARLANAAVAAGREMREWALLADTVMISLSKGLGAPVGSLLAGTAEQMQRAWRIRRRFGGGMRQSGLLAAAGLYALRHNLTRLAEDHRRARVLADAAARIPGISCEPPETNIVMLDLEPGIDPDAVLKRLEEEGVRMVRFGPRRLRAVTSYEVDDEGIRRASDALLRAIEGAARPGDPGV